MCGRRITVAIVVGDRVAHERARIAVAALFCTNGALFANLLLGVHLSISAVLFSLVALLALRWCLTDSRDPTPFSSRRTPHPGDPEPDPAWLMRLGFLLSPPLVGSTADATSLRFGLLVVPAAGVPVILLAGVLPRRRWGVTPAA